MARLTRVYQKVFASNASNNGVFGSLQAGNPTTSNDVATLQSLSAFENGWDYAIEQGDKLPPLEEFQGIQYGISYQQAYILQEGIAEWEATTPYYKGSLAKTISGSSFKLYCSLTDNNVGNAVSDTDNWKLVMDSDAPYATKADVFSVRPLLSFIWSDFQINDQSWLRADTFSWQNGSFYTEVYDHLVDDIDGITATTETIGSYTITVYVATDGHKVVMPDQETTLQNIYNESGIAWYYVLDTTNQRFKLPRTKYGFVGYRDTVGKYVEAGLPNITGSFISRSVTSPTGAFTQSTTTSAVTGTGSDATTPRLMSFRASKSNSIYGNSSTVQPPATQMYLYFYVGQFSQTATQQTAGLNASLFNGKVDLDLNNMNPSATAKKTIVGWGMPDYSAVVSRTVGTTYTASVNGYIFGFFGYTDGNTYSLYINGTAMISKVSMEFSDTDDFYILPVKKGDTYRCVGSGSSIKFVPCVGG